MLEEAPRYCFEATSPLFLVVSSKSEPIDAALADCITIPLKGKVLHFP